METRRVSEDGRHSRRVRSQESAIGQLTLSSTANSTFLTPVAHHRIAGPFTSMPFSIIFSSSTFVEISNPVARLTNSFWMK